MAPLLGGELPTGRQRRGGRPQRAQASGSAGIWLVASSLFGGFSYGEKFGIGILTKKEFKTQERRSHNRAAKGQDGILKMHLGPFQCGLWEARTTSRPARWETFLPRNYKLGSWEPAVLRLWPCMIVGPAAAGCVCFSPFRAVRAEDVSQIK